MCDIHRVYPTWCGGMLETRKKERRPDMGFYFGRQWPVYGNNGMPLMFGGGNQGVGEAIHHENVLFNTEQRASRSTGYHDLREMVIPPSVSMTYLPHGWQQPDDLGRNLIFSRMMVDDPFCAHLDDSQMYYYNKLHPCNPTTRHLGKHITISQNSPMTYQHYVA